MTPALSIISNGRKFLWDGQLYDNKEEASSAAESYQKEDFQIHVMEEGGKFLVYTRRTAQQTVVTTQ